MLRPATLTLTANEEQFAYTYPYRDGASDKYSLYKVPLYQMFLEGDGEDDICQKIKFLVMRYGVRKDVDGSHRVTGMSSAQTHTLKWIQSKRIGMVWQITGNHLLHTSGMHPMLFSRGLYAVSGCVGITGYDPDDITKHAWVYFNEKVLELTGASNQEEASKNKLLTMNIEPASPPKAKFVKTWKPK